MKNLFPVLLLLLGSCSLLMSAGSAAGGAAIGSLAGPGGAAVGAAGGVVAAELMKEEEVGAVVPQGGIASTVHETTSLIETIGLWYLLIFVLLPFLTKRGRGWFKNFTNLHDNVSKKDVADFTARLDNLEEATSSTKEK